jgi:hypothetical protein
MSSEGQMINVRRPEMNNANGGRRYAFPPYRLYGVVLLMAAIAYFTLQQLIIASQGRYFSRSQAELGNALYFRQAKLGAHFRF